MARKGLAHFRVGDARACSSTLEEAIRFHKSVETVERLDTDFFLAMAHYYLAALPHLSFRELKLDPQGSRLAQVLDEKARLLLLSQAGYIRAIKAKNPYWAAASGFQIGSLYREFYTALLMALPDFTRQAAKNARQARIPLEEAKRQLVQVYLEEVHKAVRPLLLKAIRVFEKNVEMSERVGVQSNWVGKSRRQVQELKHLISLSPKDAVELVRQEHVLPEDSEPQPAPAAPEEAEPVPSEGSPKGPGADPPPAEADEPGRVVL